MSVLLPQPLGTGDGDEFLVCDVQGQVFEGVDAAFRRTVKARNVSQADGGGRGRRHGVQIVRAPRTVCANGKRRCWPGPCVSLFLGVPDAVAWRAKWNCISGALGCANPRRARIQLLLAGMELVPGQTEPPASRNSTPFGGNGVGSRRARNFNPVARANPFGSTKARPDSTPEARRKLIPASLVLIVHSAWEREEVTAWLLPSCPLPAALRPSPCVAEGVDWLVVGKPAHLLVHPTRPDGTFTLLDALRGLLAFEIANGGQVSLIHPPRPRNQRRVARRQDDGGGAGGIPSSDDARAALGKNTSRSCGAGRIGKRARWTRRCCGKGEKRAVAPSGSSARSIADGAPARTRLETVAQRFAAAGRRAVFAFVRAWPETGRHPPDSACISRITGHPVVGDKIYGPDEGCYLEFIETGWTPALARVPADGPPRAARPPADV